MDANLAASTYLALRAKKRDVEAKHKVAIQAIDKKLEVVEAMMAAHLKEVGADSVKTSSGTFFKKKSDSVRVENKAEFYAFVMDQIAANGISGLYFLTGAASKSVVKEFLDAGRALPAGIVYEQFTTIGVQAPRSKTPIGDSNE